MCINALILSWRENTKGKRKSGGKSELKNGARAVPHGGGRCHTKNRRSALRAARDARGAVHKVSAKVHIKIGNALILSALFLDGAAYHRAFWRVVDKCKPKGVVFLLFCGGALSYVKRFSVVKGRFWRRKCVFMCRARAFSTPTCGFSAQGARCGNATCAEGEKSRPVFAKS